MYKKLLAILLSIALVASFFCGCAKIEVTKTSAQSETKVEVQTETQNETENEESQVIMRTGNLAFMNSAMDSDISSRATEDGYSVQFYDDFNSLILALKSEKIDSIFMLPEVVARYIENNVDGVKAIEPLYVTGTIGLSIGTLKEKTETYNLFNDAINKLLNNGTIDRLNEEYLDKYIRTKEEPKSIDMPIIDEAKTLKIAVTGDLPPIDFVAADGRPTGYNIALLSEISKIANVNIELVQINSAARLTALKTNAVDAVFYTFQNNMDNIDSQFYADLPDEIVVTKPYYTSRIYEVDSIKKMEELAASGISEKTNKAQDTKEMIAGTLSYAGFSEEEYNNMPKKINSIHKYYDDLNSMMLAMRSGQIDYISLIPKSTAEYINARNDDVMLEKSSIPSKERYSMATLEENKEVYNILNDNLNSIIKDGTIKNLEKKYIGEFIENKGEPEPATMPHFDGVKTIKIAVTGDLPPFDFVSADGRPAGYNVALLSEIANRAKVNIELVPMDEKAKVTALATKNIDAIFWLSSIKYADERNTFYDCPKGVILSDCYYEDEICSIYIKGGKFDKEHSVAQSSEESKNDGASKEFLRTGMLPLLNRLEEEEKTLIKDLNWDVKYYDDINSMLLALKSDKIDYISLLPEFTAKYIVSQNNDFDMTKSIGTEDDRMEYYMATLESNKEVYDMFNDTLSSIINDGTIKTLESKYIDAYIKNGNEPEPVDMPYFDNAKTIKVAVTGDLPPFDFVSSDGKPAGYNVALLSEIAKRININIELVSINAGARATALSTGNVDVIFWICGVPYDKTRNEKGDCPEGVITTVPYYNVPAYLVYKKDGKFAKLLVAHKEAYLE